MDSKTSVIIIREKKSHETIEKCACYGLHIACQPQVCPQQQFAISVSKEYAVTFEDLRAKALGGCTTCAAVVDGLSLPQIKKVWLASIPPAVEDKRADTELRKVFAEMSNDIESVAEKYIPLTILPPCDTYERRVVRTNASHDSRDWRHFNFNISQEVSNKSCTPFPALSCFPVDHTDSKDSFTHLTSWLERCKRTHSCHPQSPVLLPKRVLRIAGDRVFLHLSKDGERGRYTTLSYTWGHEASVTLTQRNLHDLTRGIALSNLPKTSQDAVKITQHIGIGFIWIDALCIMQTDAADWEEQSVKMCDVYGSSYLNIAANDSTNPNGGCFRHGKAAKNSTAYKVPGRPHLVIRQQPHFTHHDFGSNYRVHSGTAPLLKRSWVLQERLLAPRVVYYGKDELVWECNEMSDCQCGGITVITRFKEYLHHALSSGNALGFAWMRVSERYSSLDITYDKDRAIALSGIAKQANKSGKGGKYLAGLWEQDLAHQLCWRVTSTWRRPTEYIAPSWSWLSVFGPIQYCNRMDFQANASRIDVIVTSASCTAAQEDGTGALHEGNITINGRALDMQAEIQTFVRDRLACYRLLHAAKELEYTGFYPDYVMDAQTAVAITQVTIVYWGKLWPAQNTFMVLTKVHTDSPVYQRLGVFELSSDEDQIAQKLITACQPVMGILII